MMRIKSHKIDAANFRAYGMVVMPPTGAPDAQADSYKYWSDIANYHIDGDTEIGYCIVFRCADAAMTAVERHRATPEILIPIDAPFILPVFDGDADSEVRAFTVDVGQAVVIDADVWHGPCLPVGREQSSYFVIFRRGTPQNDNEKRAIQKTTVEL
ncbi:ureidoglycolate lyase [candidate division KSB1 bacterium]|nr:ureidoglycolate lyase [candidate division KSB1 bacterium]RQW05968.1 MAG: hypothetical protein EH222_09390 [candidate division KSB1 bacterium]